MHHSSRFENFNVSVLNLKKARLLILALFAGFLVSCLSDQTGISYLEPVDYSWEDIKERGSIRLISPYNSSAYFIHRGVERGFDYEFLREFARSENLVLEVVIAREKDNPEQMLNRGEGDILAGQVEMPGNDAANPRYSQPYLHVNDIIVTSAESQNQLVSLDQLEGLTVHVRKSSRAHGGLLALQKQGSRLKIVPMEAAWDDEALLIAVSSGEIQSAVVDENHFKTAASYLDNLSAGPVVISGTSVSLGVRKNNPILLKKLNAFVESHIRWTGENDARRSAFFATLMQRYFEDPEQVIRFKQPLTESKWAGSLSPFDKLVQPLAEEYGIDWKLIVAIMAQESLFDPQAKSWAGAVGLMQVMPKSASVAEQKLLDPETNVREGLKILSELNEAFAFLDDPHRTAFMLAGYNAGIGHLNDARRVAMDLRKDPNKWEDVSAGFLKLMNRAYYENARYGFCRGVETVRYVKEVMHRHKMYESVLNLADGPNNRKQAVPAAFMLVR